MDPVRARMASMGRGLWARAVSFVAMALAAFALACGDDEAAPGAPASDVSDTAADGDASPNDLPEDVAGEDLVAPDADADVADDAERDDVDADAPVDVEGEAGDDGADDAVDAPVEIGDDGAGDDGGADVDGLDTPGDEAGDLVDDDTGNADAVADADLPGPDPGEFGGACATEEDCAGAGLDECRTEVTLPVVGTVDLPRGYCTTGCERQLDCDEGICGWPSIPFCLQTCETDADCRTAEGYSCYEQSPVPPLSVCVPPT